MLLLTQCLLGPHTPARPTTPAPRKHDEALPQMTFIDLEHWGFPLLSALRCDGNEKQPPFSAVKPGP